MKKRINNIGFTLMELLIVIGIIGILSTIMVLVINPQRQLAKARDSQRRTDLFSILSAVFTYANEHGGSLPDTDGDPETDSFPTVATCIGTQPPCFDLASAGDTETIVPEYLPLMPMDPDNNVGTTQDTGYLIYVDANGRIHAIANGETTEGPIEEIQ